MFAVHRKKAHRCAETRYFGLQVDVTNRSARVDLANYVYSGEWELIEISVVRNEVFYACCKEPYPDVTFYVIMRRSISRRHENTPPDAGG